MTPFKRGTNNIFHIQSNILIALVPIVAWGVFVFGTLVITLLFISVFFSALVETAFYVISKDKTRFSPIRPIIIGTLSCLILPIASPVWAYILSSLISTTVSLIYIRTTAHGTSINPIATSGIIMFGLFGKVLKNFTAPFDKFSAFQFSTKDSGFITTLLQSMKNGTDSVTNSTLLNSFLGRDSGSIGEISTLLILIGGIFMIYKKYISWHIPVSIISTVFLISFFFPTGNCEAIYCAAIEILSGGVFFYSFFVASLPCSSPITKSGKIFFGISIGVIIMLLRRFTSAYDGTMVAVGIMSCFTSIIDNFSGNKYFSYLSTSKKTEAKPKTDLEALLNGTNKNGN